jgi:YjbE family integral membrane protein
MLGWLSAIGGIILVDLVLSGDNALVIGAAAAALPRRQRFWAILCGGGGAIVCRIAFALLATLLLQLPFIGAIGGIIVLYIAIRLLIDRSKDQQKTAKERAVEQSHGETARRSFMASLLTIVVADLTMSLDNILAVGALAAGNVFFVIIGLLISICLLLLGSAVIAELINRLPWLLDIACLVLAWTAAHILLGDDSLQTFFAHVPWIEIAAPIFACAIVVGADIYLRRQVYRWQQSHAV